MWEIHSSLSRRELIGGGAVALLGSFGCAASNSTRLRGVPVDPVDPGPLASTVTIPPQSGKAVPLGRNQRLKVITPEGIQVSDLFAFVRSSPDEFLCPRNTMTRQRRLYPQVGNPFYSNKRRPLLMLEEDTVGVHDLFYPACGGYSGEEDRPSCRRNLNAALRDVGFTPGGYAEPHNLFQNSPAIDMDGRVEIRESPARPGDYVLLQALDDLLVVATSCAVTGLLNGNRPKPIVLEIYG